MSLRLPALVGLSKNRSFSGLGLFVRDTPKAASHLLLSNWYFDPVKVLRYELIADKYVGNVNIGVADLLAQRSLVLNSHDFKFLGYATQNIRTYVSKVDPYSIQFNGLSTTNLYINRCIAVDSATFTVSKPSLARLVATRNLILDSFDLNCTTNAAKLNLKRNPFVWAVEYGEFSIKGKPTKVNMEINMITQGLTQENIDAIAAAVLAAAKLEPIKADAPLIVGNLVSEVAEAVVTDSRTLTVSKFLGLK